MPVFNDPLWWDIWRPWMLLWLLTAASAVALVAQVAGARRHARHPYGDLVTNRTCLYLDNRTIMDQYQMNRYAVALRKEVEQRTRTTGAAHLGARNLPFISPDASLGSDRQVVTKYIEQAEAVSVIGVIVDGLERGDAIVHADLIQGTVRRNAALARIHLPGTPPGRVRLSSTETLFVLLTGDFERDETASCATRTVFVSPYGAPASPAQVRLSCHPAELRTDIDSGRFPALCLGKVRNWQPAEGVLDVRPLAIFS
ncbi:hypothetical protein [Streptomyces sp.]|uniref:hypothetical protein n=1 Tax=Streptomyces sp. TaxID=1931 RepID=UPI002F416ACE